MLSGVREGYKRIRLLRRGFDAGSQAVEYWKTLPSDAGSKYDKEIVIDAASIAPTITWGTSPEDALPITAVVPNPADAPNPQ
eukprot:110260-Prorocentrum_minimum.AAC.1